MKSKPKERAKLHKAEQQESAKGSAVNLTVLCRATKWCCTQATITHMSMLGQKEIHTEVRAYRLFNLLPHTLAVLLDHLGLQKHS